MRSALNPHSEKANFPTAASARLLIDGKLEQVVDYQRDVANRRVSTYSKSGLRNGEHEVTIEISMAAWSSALTVNWKAAFRAASDEQEVPPR